MVSRKFFVAPEDIGKGVYVPIEYDNPNIIDITECNACGVTVGDEQRHEAYTTYQFSLGQHHMRNWNGHICVNCKTSLTLAVLEARIVNGTVK